MPSIDLDFTKQVKKMSSDIGIDINDLADEYSLTSKNQYKRQLTIDLTGKPATNLVCVVFDHFALVTGRKSALNCCDLRVFDLTMATLTCRNWIWPGYQIRLTRSVTQETISLIPS